MSITVQNVRKRYGKFAALDGVSIEAPTGRLLALLGPSGSGKTTLLRVIAGLEPPDSGTVHYHDDDITARSARDRNVGFVFQHYALFRHMTVFENVAFGLRVRKWADAKVRDRVHELLHLIRLDELGGRYPSELSGGQRQRVALARALAPAPKILLLDEPFGALDAQVRQELRSALRRLHDELHVTSIFVTHDQEEAFEVADQVVVMNQGRVEQTGTPQEVFEHPANAFVMDFLGDVNVFHARLENGRAKIGGAELPYPDYPHPEGRDADVYVRPHELEIDRVCQGSSCLHARIVHINPAGSVVKVRLLAEEFGLAINVDLTPPRQQELGLKVGEHVHVFPQRIRVFVPDYTI
ncbi:MAG TPA: sulfate/molybdate ABC transporter ATP-binding protein [Gemmataceae bacterium]|jgi:sulfate transport system ATP-binding protein